MRASSFMMILKHAKDNNYAIPAFSFDNFEMLQAIILAAEKQKAPTIIMVSKTAITSIGFDYLLAMTNIAITKAKVPIMLQLEQCADFRFIKTKITPVFGAIAFDYTQQSLKENMEKTKEIVQLVAPLGIFVEGKLIFTFPKKTNSTDNIVTSFIDDAILFKNKTNISALGLEFINKNDFSSSLTIALVTELVNKMSETPLVLTNSFDLTKEQLASAIKAGVSKINFNNELKISYFTSLKTMVKKEFFASDTTLLETTVIAKMQKIVETKIIACNAHNQVK